MKNVTSLSIVLSILVLALQPAYSQEINKEADGLYSTRMLKSIAPMGTARTVVIKAASSLRGRLGIFVSDSGDVSLTYFKKAKTEVESLAIDYIDVIAVALDHTPTSVRLTMRAPNPAPWKKTEYAMVEAELTIPRNCAIDIDAAYFDIEARGPFTELINTSSLGRLDVSDVTERLDVATANRRVSVERISGEVSVSTSNSTLVAREIDCGVGQASFRNDGGDIRIAGLAGEINVKNSYGRIDISGFKPKGNKNYIRSTSGPIIVAVTEMSGAQLLINNRYEDIDLTIPSNVSSVLTLAVDEGGKIEASNFPFRTELVESNRLNIVAGDGEGLISGSIRGKGNIYVRAVNEGE